MNFISNSTAAMVKDKVARYSAAYKADGRTAGAEVRMNRYMVLAETEERALQVARRGLSRWWSSFMSLWHKHNIPPTNVNYPPEIDGQIADGRAIARRRPRRWNSARAACGIGRELSGLPLRVRRPVAVGIDALRTNCSSATSCRRCAKACRSRRNRPHDAIDTIAPPLSALGRGHRRNRPPSSRAPPRRKAGHRNRCVGWSDSAGGSGDIVCAHHGGVAVRRSVSGLHREQAGASTNISIQTGGQCAGDGNTL
jgi:hypothetical protein